MPSGSTLDHPYFNPEISEVRSSNLDVSDHPAIEGIVKIQGTTLMRMKERTEIDVSASRDQLLAEDWAAIYGTKNASEAYRKMQEILMSYKHRNQTQLAVAGGNRSCRTLTGRSERRWTNEKISGNYTAGTTIEAETGRFPASSDCITPNSVTNGVDFKVKPEATI